MSRRLFGSVLAFLLTLACGAIAPFVPSVATPTPTRFGYLPAIELTASPWPLTPPPAPGQLYIQGYYSQHNDVTVKSGTGFVHTKVDMTAGFYADDVGDNKLEGKAQIIYSKAYEMNEPSCQQNWQVPLSWFAKVTGTYARQADGSIQISLVADPKLGPSYAEDYVCLGKTTPESPPFPGAGGTLVNGRFTFHKDLPPGGSDATGQATIDESMWEVSGP